jgi:hypothetical protein
VASFTVARLNGAANGKDQAMSKTGLLMTAIVTLPLALGSAASAQTAKMPNIVIIMVDDVGIWSISAYHRGMMGGSTPNIDRRFHFGYPKLDVSSPQPTRTLAAIGD